MQRMAGHGRKSPSLACPSYRDWIFHTANGIAQRKDDEGEGQGETAAGARPLHSHQRRQSTGVALMQKFLTWIQEQAGNALQGATVQVNIHNGGAATIYSDNGITPMTNPITTGQDGGVAFFTANGFIDLIITKPGVTFNNQETSGIFMFDSAPPVALGGPVVGSINCTIYDSVGNGSNTQLRLANPGGSTCDLRCDGTGNLVLSPTAEIRINRAVIALGGGAVATLGSTGGSGPTSSNQDSWLKFLDSNGNA